MQKILITGEIGWDCMPAEIIRQLNEANGKDIDVHIASPGGFVFDGISIYNAFRDYKRNFPEAQMMATIKGLAASMASYLAVNPAFDLVTAEDNAVFMIHNVFGGVVGDWHDMEKSAEVFKGLTDLLSQAYAKKTGLSLDDIQKKMDENSWYFGEEIKDAGFIDDIIKSPEEAEPLDKNIALAQAKLKFQELSSKLSTKEINVQKAAALLQLNPKNEESKIPASNAGNNKPKEVISMTELEKFLSENPAAKTQFEANIKDAKEAGIAEGKKSVQDIVAKATKFLGDAYPKPINNIAIDVIKGEKGVESLETTAAAFDALKEANKSINALIEQPKDTLPQDMKALSTDGIIRTDADIEAHAKGGN